MSAQQLIVPAVQPAPRTPVPHSWDGRPTLVLNANSFMRTLLVNVLREAGVRDIILESHASRAIHAMHECAPALVVADWTDQKDPDEDRVRLLQRIRTAEGSACRDTPVILLSSPRPRSDVERARDAGASEYLVTPLAPITMINRLKALKNDPRDFVDASRFVGPDRRRRIRRERGPSFKRMADVEAGLTNPMAAARSAAQALALETRRSGDPLAIRIGRSLQRFIAEQDSYTAVEEEVAEMHRAALAQLTRMTGDGDPLRDAVVSGLEQIVERRLKSR
ncbi:response regulator [Maricaulis sp.]|uniref:response regulator n=1 Tax=Maricaulis sp. TaxID=1486257 RepID=UPI003A911BDD